LRFWYHVEAEILGGLAEALLNILPQYHGKSRAGRALQKRIDLFKHGLKCL
jgi:hypothetical protein